jgi:hypothetical protein
MTYILSKFYILVVLSFGRWGRFCISLVSLPTSYRASFYLITHHLSYRTLSTPSFRPTKTCSLWHQNEDNVTTGNLPDQIPIQRWTSVFRAYRYLSVSLPLPRSPNLRFDSTFDDPSIHHQWRRTNRYSCDCMILACFKGTSFMMQQCKNLPTIWASWSDKKLKSNEDNSLSSYSSSAAWMTCFICLYCWWFSFTDLQRLERS